MTHRILWESGEPCTTLTDAQKKALQNIGERWALTETIKVSPMFGSDGCVMVDVGAMWLGVETDGHTHS